MKSLNTLLWATALVAVLSGCQAASSPQGGDSTRPSLVSHQPADLSADTARDTVISVTFSEAMTSSTVTTSSFSVVQGNTPVVGTVSLEDRVATFHPSAFLAASTTYTVNLTATVQDASGNTLAGPSSWSFTTGAAGAGPAPVFLGTAASFVLLAKTAISTVPTSVITGDVGISPAAETYLTGFSETDATGWATSPQVTGLLYSADMAPPTPAKMTEAVSAMETAYTDAAGRPTPDFTNLGAGEIGGLTLTPGLYSWGTGVTATTNVTLSGGAHDVWILQTTGDLTLASGVLFTLSGGAQARNVYWQVAGQATMGAGAHLQGIVLGQTAIVMQTGSTLTGRALSQTAITLDQATMTQPSGL